MSAVFQHTPVLAAESLSLLLRGQGGRYLDATLGLGGHAAAILRAAGPEAELLGLDRDPQALEQAKVKLAEFGRRAHTERCSFADFEAALERLGWDKLDGALADLGVSSLQLDNPERGFSFLRDGPLDMRMGAGEGETAAALIRRSNAAELERIISDLGEDPQAGRIAGAIARAAAAGPLDSTLELARIVEAAYPASWRGKARRCPATRTFQALRMAVNNELEQLRLFLTRIVPRLKQGGRLVIISFHSLEDRLTKNFFREEARGCVCPPQFRECRCGREPSLRLLVKGIIRPDAAESAANPRARSARLRAVERTDKPYNPAWTAA